MPSTLEKITTALNEIKHLTTAAEKEAKLRADDHDKITVLEGWMKDIKRRVETIEKAKGEAITQRGLRSWQVWMILLGMIPGLLALVIAIIKLVAEK
jgi:hypothetical protein